MPQIYNRRGGADAYPCWAVYIGRPSKWGNPFTIEKDGTRDEVIAKYEAWLHKQPALLEAARRELKGKDLLCWCAPAACHGDVLLRIANEDPKPVQLIFRPLLVSSRIGTDYAGRAVVLIDNEQAESEQLVALWHETLHLLGLRDEDQVEALAQKLAASCPEILGLVKAAHG